MYTSRVLLIGFPLFAGCDYVASKAADTLYDGTLKGVELCISRNESQLVDDLVIRHLCVTEHERLIFIELGGTAYFTSDREAVNYPAKFTGSFTNDSANYVISGFTVTVVYTDSKKDTKSFSGLWIEPEARKGFNILSDELTADVDHSALGSDDFDWTIGSIYGIKIAID